MYAIIRSSSLLMPSHPPRVRVARLRVQYRQYMVQFGVVSISTRSGYRCVSPFTGESLSSSSGSSISKPDSASSGDGTDWSRIGSAGSSVSMREK